MKFSVWKVFNLHRVSQFVTSDFSLLVPCPQVGDRAGNLGLLWYENIKPTVFGLMKRSFWVTKKATFDFRKGNSWQGFRENKKSEYSSSPKMTELNETFFVILLAFFRYSAPIYWLVHGHVTSNKMSISMQHCKNYDVKRETVHCYPRNVDLCCTWSEVAWCRWNLSAFFKICFVLLYI